MISVIIASYNEPKSTLRSVNIFLKQLGKEDRVIVVDPFSQVEDFLKQNINDSRFSFFLDPGEGKSYALNLLFQEMPGSVNDFFILTDGDVYVSDNAVKEIKKAFKDEKIGCVTGRPISIDDRNTKYGYWSHLFFDGVDKARRKISSKEGFLECSGYLFAIRKGVILDFPLETSEDSIIPYLFWKKSYKIKYLPNAQVYVKNPSNFKDWVNQKVRNIKAHENLNRIAPDMPRTKSFFNEVKWGTFFALTYAKSLREFFWTIQAFIARFYIYYKSFKELKSKKSYKDGWRETEINSTKPLD